MTSVFRSVCVCSCQAHRTYILFEKYERLYKLYRTDAAKHIASGTLNVVWLGQADAVPDAYASTMP